MILPVSGDGLPSGEVTFVFTDIEGSTRLLRALGDQYAEVLARHRQILRAAAATEGGAVVDTEGDAMFFAFADAAAALRAALAGQRALGDEAWPSGGVVRVRLGVHTGAAAPVDGRYVSLAVHQAARIAAAGHGGQIVFSDATLSAADDVTHGILRDLGQHYLKDFDEPIRLWQLTGPGAPADFPTLRTGEVRVPFGAAAPAGVSGLPVQWTAFIGREQELRTTAKALTEARLVTLLGPGGVGKTRLAVEVVRAAAPTLEHGGAFVELVPVRDQFLVQAVAAAFGITGRAGQTLDDAVLEYLAPRHSLVVLDNCEHLLGPVAQFVGRLLAGCPNAIVLATSRERLGVPGERVITVPPLSTEVTGDDLMPSEAIRLFLDRAQFGDDSFDEERADIAELCARLDGMPLAIELAAARTRSLGATSLLAGLGDQLRLLSGGRSADERHRSLRSVLDWSYGLLDDEERCFLRRLSAFVGAFELGAATAVAADDDEAAAADLLGRLADKSLIVHQRGGVSRWRLLETVRSYAVEKLVESGEERPIRARHVSWASAVAAALNRALVSGPGWRAAFDAVADDLRAALANSAGEPGSFELAMHTAHLAFAHRFDDEAIAHYATAAARAPDATGKLDAVRLAADTCMAGIRTGAAYDHLLRAADIAADAGDQKAQAICLANAVIIANRFPAGMQQDVPLERLAELLAGAWGVAPPGDPLVDAYLKLAAAWNVSDVKLTVDAALADAALAAARAAGDPVLVAGALDAVLAGLQARGRLRASFELSQERLAIATALPANSPRAAIELSDTLHMLNEQALAAGELPTALQEMRRIQLDDVMAFVKYNALSKLMVGLTLTGRFDEAMSTAEQMWTGWLAAGSPPARWLSPAVLAGALAHGLCGQTAEADEWVRRARRIIGNQNLLEQRNSGGFGTFVLARLAVHAGRLEDALAWTGEYVRRTPSWYVEEGRWYYDAYVWALDAELGVRAGRPDAQDRLAAAAPVGDESRWAAACLDRARGLAAGDGALLERSVAGWEAIDARFERACTLLSISGRADEGRAELAAIGATEPR